MTNPESKSTKVEKLTHIIDIQISRREDIPKVRQQGRQLLQAYKTSMQDQAQISWILSSLAQHIVSLSNEGTIIVSLIECEQRQGIQFVYKGSGLPRVGPIYHARMLPIIRPNDDVKYQSGRDAQLSITAWFSKE